MTANVARAPSSQHEPRSRSSHEWAGMSWTTIPCRGHEMTKLPLFRDAGRFDRQGSRRVRRGRTSLTARRDARDAAA
jgi:hypothetical protein